MDIQRIKETFEKQGTFAVIVGQSYGVDEMASALSIYLTLKSTGKDVSIVSAKQPVVEVSNLVGIDRVRPGFESNTGDLIVSFPYQQNEIGKVSYTLENGLLNIIVKPKDAPLSFGEKDVIFRRSGSNPDVIITVGVKRISELQEYFDVQSLKDTVIVNIDKQGTNEGFGDVVVIGQNSSSVSEQIASLMMELGYPIESDMSQNLMSGIIGATRNFQSPKTSSLAFEMASMLLRNGANREIPRTAQQPPRTPQQFGYNMRKPQGGQPRGSQGQPRGPQGQPRMQSRGGQPQGGYQQQSRGQQNTQNLKDYSDPNSQVQPNNGSDAPEEWLTPKILKGSTPVE